MKAGFGTLTLNAASKGYTGATYIQDGVLKLNGDYQFADNEQLHVALHGSKTYGKLESTGKPNVSKGGLNVRASAVVQKLASDLKNQDVVWQDVVKAQNLEGQFKTFNVLSDKGERINTTLLKPKYDGNTVDIIIGENQHPQDAPNVQDKPQGQPPKAQDPNQNAPQSRTFAAAVAKQGNTADLPLAQALDRTITHPTAGTKALALALELGKHGLNDAQLARAAGELQPLLEGAANRIAADQSRYAVQAVKTQAYSEDANIWVQALGGRGRLKANANGLSGYRDKHAGIVGDAQIPAEQTNIGIAHVKGDADSTGGKTHRLESKTTQALVYAKHKISDGTQLYGHIGGGIANFEGERRIGILAKTTAKAKYRAEILQTGIGIRHRIGSEAAYIAPYAASTTQA